MTERLFIRVFVGTALGAALLAFALVSVPADPKGDPDLPAAAFEQSSLYRLEVALLVFYGDLLLITPAFSGLIRGRLPIEISTRGARFAEEAGQSGARNEAAIRKLEETARDLSVGLATMHLEVERLKRPTR